MYFIKCYLHLYKQRSKINFMESKNESLKIIKASIKKKENDLVKANESLNTATDPFYIKKFETKVTDITHDLEVLNEGYRREYNNKLKSI